PRPDGLPERYAVFFGQFAPWQRLGVLLAAAEDPNWPDGVDLVIVGDGALRPAVESAAGRNSRIRYLGTLPYAEVGPVVANALASAVLTYAPERAGYSPLKLYESMACGVPVVCSDTPGQAEYVREHDAGIVVPPENPAAVAGAVAALAADPDAARAMGARGRRAVEQHYSWNARARQRLAVIESAVERRTAG
ncbi:MAG TPA: glycosyltransferase, partial [Coriobacteriia bacterium]|nr:glycosyltransferase [Coriobacteriia bacterium]